MAKIGLKNFKYSKLDNEDNVTTLSSLGKAVSCSVSIDSNNAELYADDGICESDYSFKKGTIKLEIDEDNDAIFADLLGHTYATSGNNANELICNANDVAPYVAVGRILTKIVNGVKKFKVEYLNKVKFKEPNSDEKTKGESVEFATSSVEGTIITLTDGSWRKAKEFANYSDAETYLNGLLTAPTPPTPQEP